MKPKKGAQKRGPEPKEERECWRFCDGSPILRGVGGACFHGVAFRSLRTIKKGVLLLAMVRCFET